MIKIVLSNECIGVWPVGGLSKRCEGLGFRDKECI